MRLSAKIGAAATDPRYPALAAEIGSLDAATLAPQRIEQGLAKLAAERESAPAKVNAHKAFLSLAYRWACPTAK